MTWRKADYIYVERINGKKNDIQVKEQSINERLIVHIRQTVKESRHRRYELEGADKQESVHLLGAVSKEKLKRLQKYDKNLLCLIGKFWRKETVVVGEESLTRAWDMPNELFRIKQEILLQNVEDIVQQLGRKDNIDISIKNRTSFLLVIDSDKWKYKDVKALLWQAQKQYEDIYVMSKVKLLSMEKLEEFLIDECGVVLQHLSEEDAWKKTYDTIFFLVEREGRWDKSYSFHNRYMISEWEENRFQTLLFVALNDTINSSIKGVTKGDCC